MPRFLGRLQPTRVHYRQQLPQDSPVLDVAEQVSSSVIDDSNFSPSSFIVHLGRQVLGSVPLHQLFIPGTHNSGSYRPYSGHSSDTVFMRYLICQDEDIFHQLAYGNQFINRWY